MLRVQDQLSIIDNVLYRKRVSQGQTLFQLVLLKEYREVALESLHDAVGHMGFERWTNPVGRFNRTLLGMLGTLQEEDKLKWRDHVQPLAHAYNCTKHDTTGYSPYQLMFGRQPNLPNDVAFGLNVSRQDSVTHSEYVKKLRESLQDSYILAVEHSEKSALRNKSRYDLKVRESTLEVGDRVLVKNVGIRGKQTS